MKSLIKIKKKCEWCGKDFIALTCKTRFCSKSCCDHAYKAKLRNQKIQAVEHEIEQTNDAKNLLGIYSKEYLTPTQAAKMLGIGRATFYRYLAEGFFKAIQFKGKTLISKHEIEMKFETANPYQKRHKKERAPITEFYTTTEVREKFSVSESWVFKVGKEEHIPKVFQRGKTLWSKKHFDDYFAKKAPDEEITEWYSVEDMKTKFGMTTNAVYSFVSKFGIPKKKNKREVIYSKKHVDIAKGIVQPDLPQYYTVKEAMEKYNLSRDQLYHYIKWHKVPKIKEGKYTKISKKELDELLAPPSI